MDNLISDRNQTEIINKVKDMLRVLLIDDWKSDTHKQFQNCADHRHQTIK